MSFCCNILRALTISSLPLPFSRFKGLKLDSWLRRDAGQSEYINLACNEEHIYSSAMMMNSGTRRGCTLCIELPKQLLLLSISEWPNLIRGALWQRRVLGIEQGILFFPRVKEAEHLSRFFNWFARKLVDSCPFILHPTKKFVANPTLKGSPCPNNLSLTVLYT